MAYDFDGSTQWLSTSTVPVSGFPLTLACWFNVADVTNVHNLMGISDSTVNTQGYFLAARGNATGDPVSARYVPNTFVNADTSTGFSANTWHHGCAVFAGKDDFRAYIDGGSEGSNTAASDVSGTMDNISIGRLTRSTPQNYTTGLIAECAIWDVALTAAQVSVLADGRAPSNLAPSSLVFYAPIVRALHDQIQARSITNNGSTPVADHVAVIRKRPRTYFIPAVVGGGGFQAAWAARSTITLGTAA